MIKNGGGYDRLTWDQAGFSLRFLNKILAGKAKSKSGRSSTGVQDSGAPNEDIVQNHLT